MRNLAQPFEAGQAVFGNFRYCINFRGATRISVRRGIPIVDFGLPISDLVDLQTREAESAPIPPRQTEDLHGKSQSNDPSIHIQKSPIEMPTRKWGDWTQRVSGSVPRAELPTTPLPLSQALGARLTGLEDVGAGERGQLGCDFYPGRRANALALGLPSVALSGPKTDSA
jgi:hypothetical protein